MKRLLFIDLLSPVGHVNYDMNMLRLLNSKFEVDVIIRQSMLSQIPIAFYHNGEACPEEIFPENWTGRITNRLLFVLKWRFYQFLFIRNVIKGRVSNYDYILYSSIDIYSFALATAFSKSKKLAFVDHGIYRLNSLSVRFFYRHVLDKNIKIIALEEYIAHFMRLNGVKNSVFVINHPLPLVQNQPLHSIEVKDHLFVFAPSTSNDESFIDEIIIKASHFPPNVFLRIRSNCKNYEGFNLIVYNRRIAIDEYEKLFEMADFILLPYESSYNYRTSAILFESLSRGKRVLLWGNNTLMEYFKEYPKCVSIFKDVNDLLEKLNVFDTIEYDDKEIKNFLNVYSDGSITKQIEIAFQDYYNEE